VYRECDFFLKASRNFLWRKKKEAMAKENFLRTKKKSGGQVKLILDKENVLWRK
jgi:hypothetical protein